MGVAAILSSRPNIQICGEASNGKEAIEKARELKPDLIILDVTMPVLDGINSAKEIRTFLPEVPIHGSTASVNGTVPGSTVVINNPG
jgi:YesN/AraC family two-component response regulator